MVKILKKTKTLFFVFFVMLGLTVTFTACFGGKGGGEENNNVLIIKDISLNAGETTTTYYKGGNFYLNEGFNSTGYNFYAALEFNYSQYGNDYSQTYPITSYYWNEYSNWNNADGAWHELTFRQHKYQYRVEGFSKDVTDVVQDDADIKITLKGITDPAYSKTFEYKINVLPAVPGNIYQNNGDMHKVYEYGEEIKIDEGSTVSIEYTDETWEVVPLTADMIENFDTTVPGIKKSFTIKYQYLKYTSNYTCYTVKPKPEDGYTVKGSGSFFYCVPDSAVYDNGLYLSADGYGFSVASYNSSTSLQIINGQLVANTHYYFNFDGYTAQNYKDEIMQEEGVTDVQVLKFVRYTQFGTPVLDIQAVIVFDDGSMIFDRWVIARAKGAYISASFQSINEDFESINAIFDIIVSSIVA